MNYLIISMILFLCALIVLIERRLTDSIKPSLYFTFSVILSVLFAFRNPETTSDTTEYIKIFERVSLNENLFRRIERFEPGYCFLNRVVKYFTNDYRCFFFLVSLLSFVLLYYVLKRITKHSSINNEYVDSYFYPISFMLVYISYYGLLYNSIAIREGLAIALVYASYVAATENKKTCSCAFAASACLIHQTAILAIPIIIIGLVNIKISKKLLSKIVFGMLVFYTFGFGTVTTSFIQYIVRFLYSHFPGIQLFWWSFISIGEKEVVNVGFSVYRLFSYVVVLMLLTFCDRDENADHFSLVAVIGLGILTLFGGFEIVMRLAEYYMIAICFAIYRMLVIANRSIGLSAFRRTILIPKPFFVITLSALYYIVFLRNVVFL